MSGTQESTGRSGTARQILHALMGNIASPIGLLVSLPILSRQLGVDGRGAVAAAISPLLLATTVASLGLPTTIIFVNARDPRFLRRAMRFAGICGIAFGAAVTVGLWWLAPILAEGRQDVIHLMRVASFALVPMLVIGLMRGLAMGRHEWRRVQLEQSIGALVSVIAIVSLAVAGDLSRASGTVALAYGPIAGVVVYLIRRRLGTFAQSHLTESPFDLPRMLRFAMRAWAGELTGATLARLDQVLMVPLSGERQLGLYVLAVNIAEIPLLINNAVNQVSYSHEARNSDHEKAAQTARTTLVICIALAFLVAAFSPIFVPLIFGSAFAGAYPSIVVLLIAVAITTPGSMAAVLLVGRGRPGLRSLVLTIGAATNVIAVFAFVPQLGALGAAIATVASGLVTNICALYLYNRVTPYDVRDFMRIRKSDFVAAFRAPTATPVESLDDVALQGVGSAQLPSSFASPGSGTGVAPLGRHRRRPSSRREPRP